MTSTHPTGSIQAVKIGQRLVGEGQPLFIVAEIGKNHNGDARQAMQLIDAAKEAGVDAVKIQSHIADAEMLPESPVASHFPEPRFSYTKRVQLDEGAQRKLKSYAERQGLIFLSTPFSMDAADMLERLGVSAYKIGSGEVSATPLLEHVARKGKPVLLSSGMSSPEELDTAVATIRRHNDQLIVLHCTTVYPCPPDLVNLRVIPTLQSRFGVPIGFSDHSPHFYAALASIPLGVCLVEKHFTLSKRLYGPDHHASLEPDEMAQFVRAARIVEKTLGESEKRLLPEVEGARAVFQHSVVSATHIRAGTSLAPSMLTIKRPGTGIPACELTSLYGCVARHDIPANVQVRWEDIEK